MSQCTYLEGENIAPLTAAKVRGLIGKRIQYLRRSDIDRSGRGMYFPRTGEVTGQFGRNIELDGGDQWYSFGDFVEAVEL